jgi:hypothetical protein
MPSSSSRPWYRLHWLTWLFVLAVIGSIAHQQSFGELGDGNRSGLVVDSETEFGWPMKHMTEHHKSSAGNMLSSLDIREYELLFLPLAFNTACWLVLLVATVFVVERRSRSGRPFRVSLASILSLVTVCCVLMVILSGALNYRIATIHFPRWEALTSPLSWPLLFALACTIYTAGWLAWHTALLGYRSLRRSHN